MERPHAISRWILMWSIVAAPVGASVAEELPPPAREEASHVAYPERAAVKEYLTDPVSAEIALARSAAPASIADQADVMVGWGANEPGSPIWGASSDSDPVALFFVTVPRWSDGTPVISGAGHQH